jgi:hypothetical protein
MLDTNCGRSLAVPWPFLGLVLPPLAVKASFPYPLFHTFYIHPRNCARLYQHGFRMVFSLPI